MYTVTSRVFKAIEKSDIEALTQCGEAEVRPILPCLVRMSLIAPMDHSAACIGARKVILRLLSGIEAVNSLVALLSIDFTVLEADIKKEQTLRQKMGSANQPDSFLIQSLVNGLALEFECAEPERRIRLLLSEFLLISAQVKESRPDQYMKHSEIFDNACYIDDVGDVLSICLAELPILISPTEVAETLLHLSVGPALICKIVANQPDCFKEVVTSLIMNGDKQDEDTPGGLARIQAVRMLCQMNPSQALNAREICVEHCVMPALAVYITLDVAKVYNSVPTSGPSDGSFRKGSVGSRVLDKKNVRLAPDDVNIVSFLTGLLLSNDQPQRVWFCQFIKASMRRKYDAGTPSALAALRSELIDRLRSLLLFTTNEKLQDFQIIKATALVRLYCALRTLGGIKFNEDAEVGLLLELMTCGVGASSRGVRFVSVSLCMLIACPSLIALPQNERRVSDWIKWLAKEEAYFAGSSGVSSSSFGAMLILIAIHFHLNQLSSIIELASNALGMRLVHSRGNLTRIKQIFTQDIFTEQVVAAHSAKVAVTKNLNGDMPGFLPVHCIYDQLKSRLFTKHKVHIKCWIFKQICECRAPLHPTMPMLIEAYVNSLLAPAKTSAEVFNEPISEEEILSVFALSTFTHKNARQWHRPMLRARKKIRIRSIESALRNLSTASHTTLQNSTPKQPSKHHVTCVLTSQLLLLYYLLLYEDLRLTHMHYLKSTNRQVYVYSADLFAQLPIRYLLSSAQKQQKYYAGVFSSLLKLLVTHYPQLCLLEDWMYRGFSADCQLAIQAPRLNFSAKTLIEGLEKACEYPSRSLVMLDRMMQLPLQQLWSLAAPFVSCIKDMLKPGVPCKVLDNYKMVWMHLNSLFPRRLWAMTVESLRDSRDLKATSWIPLSEDDIVLDPLHVLRCDQKVFRCPQILEIVIYMLEVYLLSSRAHLTSHQSNNAALSEDDREKLKNALILTQESAAMQILLESTIANDNMDDGQRLQLQEVRSVICSFLHHSFIKDTTVAKLIHFQGYPTELIEPLVQGVPSMHIADGLNWIPELLQQCDVDKQLFALELTANLALQNSMPSTFSIGRLVIVTVGTLLSVLSEEERLLVMERSLQPVVKIGRAFPTLLEDIVHLMVAFGRITEAQSALVPAASPKSIGNVEQDFDDNSVTSQSQVDVISRQEKLRIRIRAAFRQLVIDCSQVQDIF